MQLSILLLLVVEVVVEAATVAMGVVALVAIDHL